MASSALPRHLPILDARLAPEGCPSSYPERELLEPVSLCDARGRLDPRAVGWSRFPRVRANLHGRWPRKKRWNFWNWIAPDFVFSATVADLDYASFCSASLIDFARAERVACMDARRGGFPDMPEEVERSVFWETRKLCYRARNEGGDVEVAFEGRAAGGAALRAEFRVRKPPDHESLNVVVPWTPRHFQLNSKHNTLRCEGEVRVGDRRYPMRPDSCHAVQDFGRGVWPWRSCWNWAVCTGEVEGELLGVNLGDRWTTGTGSNENGILHRGRLHKIMEDVEWSYDASAPEKPWRIRTRASDAVDIVLTPAYVHQQKLSLGLVASGGFCAFGRWRGVVRVDGRELRIHDPMGWAEEFSHRW
jgi:hypothetical protein